MSIYFLFTKSFIFSVTKDRHPDEKFEKAVNLSLKKSIAQTIFSAGGKKSKCLYKPGR